MCVFKRAWGAALFADQTVAYGPDTDGVSQLPQRLVECFPVPISPRSRHGISPQPTARPQNRSRCTALLTMGGSSMTSVALSCVKQRRGWDTRRPREAHSKWPIDLGDVSGRHEASSISSGRDNNNREPPSPIFKLKRRKVVESYVTQRSAGGDFHAILGVKSIAGVKGADCRIRRALTCSYLALLHFSAHKRAFAQHIILLHLQPHNSGPTKWRVVIIFRT